MTTVAQMIEWMKTLPQDAEIKCGVEESTCYERYMVYRPAAQRKLDQHMKDIFTRHKELLERY